MWKKSNKTLSPENLIYSFLGFCLTLQSISLFLICNKIIPSFHTSQYFHKNTN